MSSTSSCCDWNIDILKNLIKNTAELDVVKIIHIILQLISFFILIVCLVADQWLSGDTGHQGLWNVCYTNGTSSCCGKLDDVVGYKDFIGATRAFLIIESLIFLAIFYTIYRTVYEKDPVYPVATILTIAIGICTFLSITIYGARHGDVSKSTTSTMTLSVSYIFCALNLGLQIIFAGFGLYLCD
ncbi:epithelial membrane protein 2-like [Mytilus trossulus]|uniref:epithelial membrane protein 2-like n=1 Tax=Mytilus trossulus TaxID=6551 RepID=UPI003007040E